MTTKYTSTREVFLTAGLAWEHGRMRGGVMPPVTLLPHGRRRNAGLSAFGIHSQSRSA